MVRMGCHDRLALFVPGCCLPSHFIKKAGCAVWGWLCSEQSRAQGGVLQSTYPQFSILSNDEAPTRLIKLQERKCELRPRTGGTRPCMRLRSRAGV